MIKNYFKTAWRNLSKNKGFSAINIFGLAIGIATCLLITLYVWNELSYDKYNTKAARIYRIDGDVQFAGHHWILAVTPDPIGAALKRDFPQVEQSVRFRDYGGFLVRKGTGNVQENKVIYTDPTLFDMFTLPMLEGNPGTALQDPHTVVITESTAKKYFNKTAVVGQTLTINDTGNYKITGVIKDIPQQSHFHFDFFVSLTESDESKQNNWLSNNFNTYILLKPGSDAQALNAQMDRETAKYIGPQAQEVLHINIGDFKKSGNHDEYRLMPLTKIHLYSNKVAELEANGNIQYVYIFSAIAIFILLIACVNFMNLSTARSANRAKEVGVRKVLGSFKRDLVQQFLIESMLISCIALIIALVIAWLLLPYFNQLASTHIALSFTSIPFLLPILVLIALLTGLLAGSYPAFYLSSFQPSEVLKGKLSSGFRRSWLRSSLVVFQFFISIILIIGTIVIYRQLKFIQTKDIGYNRNQVLIIKNTSALGNNARAFKEEVQKLPDVKAATMTGWLPTSDRRGDSPLFPDATTDPKKAVSMQTWKVDDQYIPTLQMKMVAGRNFSSQMPTDSDAIIINEAAAKLLDFSNPINKTLYYLTEVNGKTITPYHVIGVVKNFNFNSLRENVTPLALFLTTHRGSIAFRVETKHLSSLISQIEAKYKSIAPGQPFAYSFMDEDFTKTYGTEQKVGKIAIAFSALAILIACLGLFGLVTYAAEQRTREIGIRKVLGASTGNIVGMLSTDFLKLVIISSLLAFPVAYYCMNHWLQDFANRINISVWIFFVAGLSAVLIAFGTISFQAIRAALANPVKSLRSE